MGGPPLQRGRPARRRARRRERARGPAHPDARARARRRRGQRRRVRAPARGAVRRRARVARARRRGAAGAARGALDVGLCAQGGAAARRARRGAAGGGADGARGGAAAWAARGGRAGVRGRGRGRVGLAGAQGASSQTAGPRSGSVHTDQHSRACSYFWTRHSGAAQLLAFLRGLLTNNLARYIYSTVRLVAVIALTALEHYVFGSAPDGPNSASGKVCSHGPRKRKSASSSPSVCSRLNMATLPPCAETS